jgi:hypothetical protein
VKTSDPAVFTGTKLGPGITAFAARSRDDHSIAEGVFDR